MVSPSSIVFCFCFLGNDRKLPIISAAYPTTNKRPPFSKKDKTIGKYVSIIINLLYMRYCGIAGVNDKNNTNKQTAPLLL